MYIYFFNVHLHICIENIYIYICIYIYNIHIYIYVSEVGGGEGSQTSTLLHVMPCMLSGQAPISAGLAIYFSQTIHNHLPISGLTWQLGTVAATLQSPQYFPKKYAVQGGVSSGV